MQRFNNKHSLNSTQFIDKMDATAESLLDDFQRSTIDRSINRNQSKHRQMNSRNHNEINSIMRLTVIGKKFAFQFG
jgi:enoyl reductase-like protein